jgi:TPR repeat protein
MFGRLGDAEAAIRWCQEAAEGGDLDGMNDLGAFLRERGRVDEAEDWFRRAAIAGHVIAADNLRRVLWKRGIRPGQIGWTEEAKWFVPAAEAGSTIAANWLAVAAAQLGKPELAEQWGLWAAELGDPDAAYARGLRLGRRKEYDESERWLERAAAGGHKKAAALLAEPRAARRGRPNFPG